MAEEVKEVDYPHFLTLVYGYWERIERFIRNSKNLKITKGIHTYGIHVREIKFLDITCHPAIEKDVQEMLSEFHKPEYFSAHGNKFEKVIGFLRPFLGAWGSKFKHKKLNAIEKGKIRTQLDAIQMPTGDNLPMYIIGKRNSKV